MASGNLSRSPTIQRWLRITEAAIGPTISLSTVVAVWPEAICKILRHVSSGSASTAGVHSVRREIPNQHCGTEPRPRDGAPAWGVVHPDAAARLTGGAGRLGRWHDHLRGEGEAPGRKRATPGWYTPLTIGAVVGSSLKVRTIVDTTRPR